ncbi:MAG: phenylalanine--tRNA ligase subunit alpha [Vicinamibacterales bacterium]
MPSLEELRAELHKFAALFDHDLTQIDDVSDRNVPGLLLSLRNTYARRNGGVVAELMRRLPELASDDRKAFGKDVNQFKARIEAALAEREAALAAARRPVGGVDITLPGRQPVLGFRHPLGLVRERVQDIFSRLGYQILEGPEIEDDYHNFEALNMPADHPARDMQDTLYLERPLSPALTETPARGRGPRTAQPLTLLRTHTSAMQIRYMERYDPPVRLVAIGPVYRRDNLDLTHTPMFHQVEGLVVGRGITLADLKGTLTAMAQQFFGPDTPVRMRPSFFPYTEPSAELDIGCFKCKGHGCSMCKHTGWMEILGSGMVHPVVFEYVGYDADEVTGFAFGMGIERVALLMWGVEDIRLFYENDLRFLEQFGL